MKKNFKIRGHNFTIDEIPDVLAIKVPKDKRSLDTELPKIGRSTNKSEVKEKLISIRGEDIKDKNIVEEDLNAFTNSGYVFISPNENTKRSLLENKSLSNIKNIGNIYQDENDHILIGTQLLTLKLKKETSEEKIKNFMKKYNLMIINEYKFSSNIYEIEVPFNKDVFDIISEISNEKEIEYVEPVFIQNLGKRLTPNDPSYRLQWQWHNDGSNGGIMNADVKAEEAWEHTRGEGIKVAVIDVSFNILHNDLSDNILKEIAGYFVIDDNGRFSFIPGIENFPNEDSFHGTFCCGMIAALANNNRFGCGIANEAKLIPIACMGSAGRQETLARAIAYAANPQVENVNLNSSSGADVISCSLGPNSGPYTMFSILEEAISYAVTNGRNGKGTPIFWAVSNNRNGNDPISIDQVCSNPNVIAVGRSTNRDTEGRSSFGPELAFLAPGVNVYSTTSNDFGSDTGTSYAAPLAAGIGALVLSKNNNLTWREVKEIIANTCNKIGNVNYDPNGHHPKYGYGRVSALNAVLEAATRQ